jgi:hypothetical protein|tara:strand:- start:504 stop:719 length:216 start_codon:yes stop_codon:yes gene_type:complete
MKKIAALIIMVGFMNVGCVFNNPISQEVSEIETRIVTDPRTGVGLEVNTRSFRVGGILYANKINEELESFK